MVPVPAATEKLLLDPTRLHGPPMSAEPQPADTVRAKESDANAVVAATVTAWVTEPVAPRLSVAVSCTW